MQFFIDIGLTLVYFSIFLMLCVWTWRFWVMYTYSLFRLIQTRQETARSTVLVRRLAVGGGLHTQDKQSQK
jgi:hypothetical protein